MCVCVLGGEDVDRKVGMGGGRREPLCGQGDGDRLCFQRFFFFLLWEASMRKILPHPPHPTITATTTTTTTRQQAGSSRREQAKTGQRGNQPTSIEFNHMERKNPHHHSTSEALFLPVNSVLYRRPHQTNVEKRFISTRANLDWDSALPGSGSPRQPEVGGLHM